MGKYLYLLFFFSGFLVIALGLAYYLSPITRLELSGVSLRSQIARRGPVDYLFGWKSVLESWTERDGRLDTPLINQTVDEVSTLFIVRLRETPALDELGVTPKEWIRSLTSPDGYKSDTLPLNHPSIAEGKVLLDKQGTLIARVPTPAWRVARALQFLFPTFPKGLLRKGSVWEDHVEWTEGLSDWTIGWRADMRWALKDIEMHYDKPCARLIYAATLTPTMVQSAAWATGGGRITGFAGQGTGEALYSIRDKVMISNTFTYAGTLRIRVSNLADVPDELRVGISLPDTAGDVALKISNRIDARIP